jgi:hypothetical protein
VSDAVIYSHLTGEKTIGVYPLPPDDTSYFLAVDFDKAEWREDATAFIQSCHELDVPVALEISRSANGAHAWIFFSTAVPAREARRSGTAIISHTCSRTRQLSLTWYDRLFPNQDTRPKGGFGNLIALPMQQKPREAGHSVFVDDDFSVYPDQWAFFATIKPMSPLDIEPAILRATGPMHPLDVTFIDEEDLATPWKRWKPDKATLPGPLPEALTIHLGEPRIFREGAITSTGDSPPDSPRGLSKPRVLLGAGHAYVGLGQAPGHRLC